MEQGNLPLTYNFPAHIYNQAILEGKRPLGATHLPNHRGYTISYIRTDGRLSYGHETAH